MKTITKEYKVYTYDELSEKAKERVRNYFGENHADDETSMMKDDFAYQLEEEHPYFKNPDFIWSLNHCQGDGLSFSSRIDTRLFIDTYFPALQNSKKCALEEMIYGFKTQYNNGRYCYASKSQVDFEIESCYSGKFNRLEALAEKVLEKAKEVYIDVCYELKTFGYSNYDHLYSDEYARETSEANEYTYLEDGEMFNE